MEAKLFTKKKKKQTIFFSSEKTKSYSMRCFNSIVSKVKGLQHKDHEYRITIFLTGLVTFHFNLFLVPKELIKITAQCLILATTLLTVCSMNAENTGIDLVN